MPDIFAPDRASAYNTGLMEPENAEKTSQGLVVLVGAGPGEATLITVAGAEWLSRADVVIYDNLISRLILNGGTFGDKVGVGIYGQHDCASVETCTRWGVGAEKGRFIYSYS